MIIKFCERKERPVVLCKSANGIWTTWTVFENANGTHANATSPVVLLGSQILTFTSFTSTQQKT